MTINLTPVHSIAYIDDLTPLNELAAASQQMAQRVETALIARGVPPADLPALIAAGWFTDSGEVALSLQSGFTALTPVTYRKVGKRITLSGTIQHANITSGMVGIILPVSIRPPQYKRFATPTNDATTTVRRASIDTAGQVLLNGSGSGAITWQSLDDVEWNLT